MVCYGGTAINNILPKRDQFYNFDIEMPDYDFFSSNAMNDAKKLADLYKKKGYDEVLATAGTHYGTFKVFVNFIPVADITQMSREVFDVIQKESIRVAQISYTPPNFLRMLMYLEISRPGGDVSRWEKVQKRLNALNKNYPLKLRSCVKKTLQPGFKFSKDKALKIHKCIRDAVTDNGFIFFGGYATGLYSKYINNKGKQQLLKIPDFDVLSEDQEKTAELLKEQLEYEGIKNIKFKYNDPIGEVVPENIEVIVGKNDTIAMIHKPIACHSYNQITIAGKKINVASIDTIMSLYLSFIYADSDLHTTRLLCMAKYLFYIQEKNKLKQRGLLKRFTNKCYGKQETLEDIRSEKSNKFKELKSNRKSKEFQEWFLKYIPGEKEQTNTDKKEKTNKRVTKKNTSTKKNGIMKLFGL